MKLKVLSVLVSAAFLSLPILAQNPAVVSKSPRPRVVENGQARDTTSRKIVVITDDLAILKSKPAPKAINAPERSAEPISLGKTAGETARLSYGEIKRKIDEAKREMQRRPIPTAITDSFLLTEVIRLAFYDTGTRELDYVVMTKESFLRTGGKTETLSSKGKVITVGTIRGNGVNTPVVITDRNNGVHIPILVQYPREKGGVLQTIAFYISSHPGLVTPEVVNAGKLYVRNTIRTAAENLRKKGISVNSQVKDMAERLSVVEHVDHMRFRTEVHSNIYNDVYALFALNEGETYKYSVSSAGAGGMVQMIPSTYRMVRSRYPQVGLLPDFVAGMTDHSNASQAMLLYMQMTWAELAGNATITEALGNGIATPAELMSAGYNSNPSKLPGYIRRGGADWKTLIPRETQIYLEINASLVEYEKRAK